MGISDHYITYCTRKTQKPYVGTHRIIKIRSLRNYDREDYINRLHNTDWSLVHLSNNANMAWSRFKIILTEIMNDIAPLKYIRIKSRTDPWTTN